MTSKIHLRRCHTLGLEGVRRALQKIADDVAESHRVESRWEGDVLHFSRQGISGSVVAGDSEIVLDAELAGFLAALKPRIEEDIQKRFDRCFT